MHESILLCKRSSKRLPLFFPALLYAPERLEKLVSTRNALSSLIVVLGVVCRDRPQSANVRLSPGAAFNAELPFPVEKHNLKAHAHLRG